MKARVKATGEILEIASYATIPVEYCDSYGNPLSFSFDEVEILSEKIESNVPDYWTRLEHQYAGLAMQGICANYTEFTKDNDGTLSNTEMIVENARLIAHVLVEKMKENEKAMH